MNIVSDNIFEHLLLESYSKKIDQLTDLLKRWHIEANCQLNSDGIKRNLSTQFLNLMNETEIALKMKSGK